MENQKYPIGIQSFSEIREGNYLYIDKTEIVYELVNSTKYAFLSRPRRFGKSLLINTLKSLFEGKKEFFKDLYIYDKMPFEAHPVIHISFDKLDYVKIDLGKLLENELRRIAKQHEIDLDAEGLKAVFSALCEKLHAQTGKKVAILIDEYDHPILHFLEKLNFEKADEMRETIREFYGVIKSLDDHIQFFFLTGISRFAKVSLFSVLNNVVDISFQKKFVTICGYTQQELEQYFPEKIKEIAAEQEMTYPECLQKIKLMYNGYSWDGLKKVYAPFSTLVFMSEMTFKNHWFTTGTPTFLLKLLSPNFKYELENIWVTETLFDNYDIKKLDGISLMFQTGYLTITEISKENRYCLNFPNMEVRNAFLQFLGGEYTHQGHNTMNNWVFDFVEALNKRELDKIPMYIDDLFSEIPYQLFRGNQENFYHAIIFIALRLTGIHIQCEVSHRKGRIDAVIHTDTAIYIFEFKIKTASRFAIQQAKDKDYYQPYLHLGKKVFLCGVSFSPKKRGIEDWKLEEMN